MGKMTILYSEIPNNLFAPYWKLFFYESTCEDVKMIDDMKEIILSKEKDIIQKYSELNDDGGTGLGKNSTTAKFLGYNVFKWTEEPFLKWQQFVRTSYMDFMNELHKIENFKEPESTYVGSWVNVMRKGQQIKMHHHSKGRNSYLGAHFCVQTEDTSTIYLNTISHQEHEFKNSPGTLLFFPDHVPHCTTVTNSDKERITIAMDIFTHEDKMDEEKKSHTDRAVLFV